MSFLTPLRTAGFALLAMASTSFAAPEDWVGKALPPLAVTYLGEKPNLKGKPVIVEFWATWCGPCRKSIPHLNELYGKYKDQGLQIVGISDEKKAEVEKFQQTLPMDYSVALDSEGALLEKLGIDGIPQAFVVGKDGKVVWTGHPMDLKEDTLKSVLE